MPTLQASRQWVIVTGGCGFIGQNLVHDLVSLDHMNVVVIDKIGYASNQAAFTKLIEDGNVELVKGNICDQQLLWDVYSKRRPIGLYHLAAESHVDRSIDSPDEFINSNILGTHSLLKTWKCYCEDAGNHKFLHVSTDEVFGTLSLEETPFIETSQYRPNSPYSASKASSDHLVRAWANTYGMNTSITNCSNNFGPYQHHEKFIPTIISAALRGDPIPIYGQGHQIRDWLYVKDHTNALRTVFANAPASSHYLVGGSNELTNLDLAITICGILDRLHPKSNMAPYAHQIQHVADRPGHDFRYAIDSSKLTDELNWTNLYSFDHSLESTVTWYLKNKNWLRLS